MYCNPVGMALQFLKTAYRKKLMNNRRSTAFPFSGMKDNELLDMRIKDLGVRIEGSRLQPRIKQLYAELDSKGISFKPECFLADEWMCPDNEPVIGIPFFLAHPRLSSLEHKMMLEVEGGDKKSCMQLLRHETGHTINYAYKLYRRKKWRELFGPFSLEYPERYKYRPYSKRFVRHLDDWYAQYHPDEDFAETFAVWLTPGSNWPERYKGWKALDKLEYVDHLMKETGRRPPLKEKGRKMWEASTLRSTLRTYYKRKREFSAENYPDFHDFFLNSLFSREKDDNSNKAHSVFVTYRKQLIDCVSLYTGEKKYFIDRLLRELTTRSRELRLYCNLPEEQAILRIAAYVTTLIMNYIYTGTFRKNKK